MALYSDTFSGSGALGNIEVGGVAWEVLAGTWSRSNGNAYTSSSGNNAPPPMAVINVGVGQVDMSAAVSSGGGDAIYFRVVDANNWWRALVYSVTESSTYYVTEYEIADVSTTYEWHKYLSHDAAMDNHTVAPWTGSPNPAGIYIYTWSPTQPTTLDSYQYQSHTHSGQTHYHEYSRYGNWAATGNSSTTVTGYYWSSSSSATSPDYWTGNTRSVPYGSSSTTRNVQLVKCSAGTVTGINTSTNLSSISTLRVRADGSSITIYANGSQVLSTSDSTHSTTGIKHGVGRGPSSNSGTALDNFTLDPLIPPTPNIVSPVNGTAVNSSYPTFVGNVNSFGGAQTKIQWQLSTTSNFDPLYTWVDVVEPDSYLRVSGEMSYKYTSYIMEQNVTHYLRARQVTPGGLAGNWSSTVAFWGYHPPAATNLSPASGNGVVIGASNEFSWVFTDTNEIDYQTFYRVVIERNDTGVGVYDSGRTMDNDYTPRNAECSITQTISSTYENVPLRWRVQVEDRDGVQSPWTSYQVFTPTTAPTVVLTSPTDGGTVATSRPTVTWNFTASGGRTQKSYRVTITKAGAVVYDSGTVNSSEKTHSVSSPVIESLSAYVFTVYVTDTLNITAAGVATVTATYDEPNVIPFQVSKTSYLNEGFVHVTWLSVPDAMFVAWRIYRRRIDEASWTRIAEISEASINEYRDYLASALTTHEYYVVQVVTRFTEEVESVVSTPLGVTLDNGGYWLIDPNDSSNSVRLFNVTEEEYRVVSEQVEMLIVGRGRHVDEGEIWGKSGSMTCQIRDNNWSTAGEQKHRIEALKAKRIPVYLRDPFGDIQLIALGEIGVSRIAGVGTSEFVDLTIPYLEVK